MYWEILDLGILQLSCRSKGLGLVWGKGLEDEGRPSSRKYLLGSALLVFVYTQAL
jgi:hypothetical protein